GRCRPAPIRCSGASCRSIRTRPRAALPLMSGAAEAAMQTALIVARTIHFAAAIALAGVFVHEALIARAAAAAMPRLRRRVTWLAWISLALALVSALAWLAAVAAGMSGGSLVDAVSRGTWLTVLTRTRFGTD